MNKYRHLFEFFLNFRENFEKFLLVTTSNCTIILGYWFNSVRDSLQTTVTKFNSGNLGTQAGAKKTEFVFRLPNRFSSIQNRQNHQDPKL